MDEPNERGGATDLPTQVGHTPGFLRRFAIAIGEYYRSLDPNVAQLIAARGVLPATPLEQQTF
jgi:hypothetical protein